MATPTSTTRKRGAPPPVKAGLVLGGFKLVELIGEGGMGSVWRGENERVRSMVRAVKIIKPELASLPDFRTRFLREAEYLEALQHPNILLVQNIDEQDGVLFMVMELLQGQSLDQLVRWSPGKLPPADVAGLLQQALVGVAHAHSRGIIHRDLKPHNLFLTQGGGVKVLDFGIARGEEQQTQLTRAGGVAPGSPAYLAPEIAHGEAASARSDVYAMGVTLYELLAGKPPFGSAPGTTGDQASLSIMFQHASKPLPDLRVQRPELPEGLAAVLQRACAKAPSDRFADAGEFARELAPFAGAEAALNLSRMTPAPGLVVGASGAPARRVMAGGSDGGGTRFEVPEMTRVEVPEDDDAHPAAARRRWVVPVVLVALALAASAGVVTMLRKASSPASAGHAGSASAAEPTSRGAEPKAPPVPAGMAALAGGTLTMGRAPYGDDEALDIPAHPVEVKPLAIEKAEVTNAEFKAFVEAGKAKAPWPPIFNDEKRFAVIARQPVINVNHEDAADYCLWRYDHGRLPTEAEWEWAARGKEGRLFPWGNDFQRVCVNGLAGEAGAPQTAEQNHCGATPEGVVDLSGNVWEWTSSPAAPYLGSTRPAPPPGFWAIRGGSFFNMEPSELTGTSRQFARAPNRFVGFRCAADLAK